ncbi:MAG: hypothetical protein L0Z50_37825 [Verrucomicrobiales bacterium]|nr:hypothetical protein [Verrucomicrobiales bacterium]
MSLEKAKNTLKWLPTYLWQRVARRRPKARALHLILALADHFEPAIVPGGGSQRASLAEQQRRLERWCRTYPSVVDGYRDADGYPFRHTYFYPAEQYDTEIVGRMADHCHAGWGEVEVQLHHGLDGPDTPEATRQTIVEFRDRLVQHGCLSRLDGVGPARYGFVHGNWALANSNHGRTCGVDNEMQILADTGCYGDFTLPSAPNPAQVAKINALYECALPLDQRSPHRRGLDVAAHRPVRKYPLIIQGPLLFRLSRPGQRGISPYIENSALTTANPPSLQRLRLWQKASIQVAGRPDWIFIKLHCHGMDPRDEEGMLGEPARKFLRELREVERNGNDLRVYFASAREMVNMVLAACDGKDGSPGRYRDYRLRLIRNT